MEMLDEFKFQGNIVGAKVNENSIICAKSGGWSQGQSKEALLNFCLKI